VRQVVKSLTHRDSTFKMLRNSIVGVKVRKLPFETGKVQG